jgi:glycosyltransferase involved in cell wall biosynthesis
MAGCLVVNFNAPELNALADALGRAGELCRLVRPFVNRDRWSERALRALPYVGSRWDSTFGRRRLQSAEALARTTEAGVLEDFLAAAIARAGFLEPARRARAIHALHERLRVAIGDVATRYVGRAESVVAYPGFAEPAFRSAEAAAGRPTRIVSYPIAHHRFHLRERDEEAERVPEFASSWPALSHFTSEYLGQLDREIELADHVVVGSRFVAETFAAEGVPARRLRIVPYGVDLGVFDRPRLEASDRPFTAVFAGQIGQRKGLSYLLEGYRRFARAGTRLVLVGSIVGPDAPLHPYRDCFEHVPHLTRPGLAAQFSASDVFVFPTLLEGMPLVVVEAMACGLPVIATARGPDEVVRDGIDGFIVPPRDPEAIASCLDRLHRDPSLRARMGAAARERSRDFSWEVFASRFRSLLARGESE